MKNRWGILNLLAWLIMIAVNILADALPLFGVTTAQVSDLYPTLIAPAPYAFAIWGLIYLLLLGYSIYSLVPAGRESGQVSRVGGLFVSTCILNALWLFSWHGLLIPWSSVIMAVLLIALITLYLSLRRGAPSASVSWQERLLVRIPFSVYLGWISVATIANIAAALVSLGIDGGSAAVFWTCLMAAVAAVLGLLMLLLHRDAAYAAVIVWALIAIGVKNIAIPAIAWTAFAGAAVVLIAAVLTLTVRVKLPSRR